MDGDLSDDVTALSESFNSLFTVNGSLTKRLEEYFLDQLSSKSSLLSFLAKCMGVSVEVLLDCGASRNFVDTAFVRKHGFHMTPLDVPFEVSLANGSKIKCSHYVKNCKLKFKQFNHVCDLYVLDLCGEHEIIMGQEFLVSRNPHIDWRERTMKLVKKHRKSSVEHNDESDDTAMHNYVESITVINDVKNNTGDTVKVTESSKKSASDPSPESLSFNVEVLSMLDDHVENREYAAKLEEHYDRYSAEYNDAVSLKKFRRAFRKHQKNAAKSGKQSQAGCIYVSVDADMKLLKLSDANGEELSSFEISESERSSMEKALREKHKDVFRPYPPAGVPPVRFPGAELKLEDGDPFNPPAKKSVHLNESQLFELRLQLQYYLEQGFIRPSDSAYATPVFFVPKPHTHPVKWRMACDYRALNSIVRRDQYPLPAVEQIIDVLKGSRVFSKLDLSQYFHQIPVAEQHVHKTAITTRYGNFEWLVVPFGIHNAPAIAQRVANVIFQDFLDHFVVIFMDDILIFSKDIETHHKHLDLFLERMKKHNLYAHTDKCEFYRTRIEYLGLGIHENGIFITDASKEAIRNWQIPKPNQQNKKQNRRANPDGKTSIRTFLGMVSFFRKFIPRLTEKAYSISKLLDPKYTFDD